MVNQTIIFFYSVNYQAFLNLIYGHFSYQVVKTIKCTE